ARHRRGAAADPRGQRGRVLVGTRDDDDVGDAEAAHTRGGERRDRAGPDDDHPGAVERADLGNDVVERDRDERVTGAIDAGLGVRTLADAKPLLEQRVQRRADRLVTLAVAQRVAYLPEDLTFADDHRVESRGHLEQVGDGGVVVVNVEGRDQGL